MAFDAYKILDEREAGSMIDLIAPCMDDYLYIIPATWKPINHATAVLLFASICNFYLIAAVLIVGVGKIVSYCYF